MEITVSMHTVLCWKSVDNDDDVPVPPMDVTCECAYDCASQTQMHNVSHTVGRWYPYQMRGGPELVVVVDVVSRAWVRSALNDVTPVLEINLQDDRSAASDSRSWQRCCTV